MRIGITYFGNYWDYWGLSEAVMDRDFSLIKNSGIDSIIICSRWDNLQSGTGEYTSTHIERLNRIRAVRNRAFARGLTVIFNIHTVLSGGNVPSYVGNQRETFKQPSLRQAWLDFVHYYVSELDAPGVEEFQLCNELGLNTWSGSLNYDGSITPQMYYDWMLDTYNAGRAVTQKPLSGRWGMAQTHGGVLEDRVVDVWDHMCVNYYEGIDTYNHESYMQTLVDRFTSRGKATWVTEYGRKSPAVNDPFTITEQNDVDQANRYRDVLDIFTRCGIASAHNWWYSGQKGTADYGWNCFNYNTQEPRPSFYVMLGYIEGTEKVSLSYLSTPIGVPATVNGAQVQSGDLIELPRGTITNIRVPKWVEA